MCVDCWAWLGTNTKYSWQLNVNTANTACFTKYANYGAIYHLSLSFLSIKFHLSRMMLSQFLVNEAKETIAPKPIPSE